MTGTARPGSDESTGFAKRLASARATRLAYALAMLATAISPMPARATEFADLRAALQLDAAWAYHDHWKNPRVERSIFTFTFRGREAQVTQLVEAEWTDVEHLVKPQDLEAVGRTPSGRAVHSMELHQLYDMPTTFGEFGAFCGVLVARDTMAPLKWDYNFYDTCGSIAKRLAANREPAVLEADGYWEGRATYTTPSLEGVWISDGLALTLRALPLAEGYAARVRLAITDRGRVTAPLAIADAKIAVTTAKTAVPAGAFDTWRVAVDAKGFTALYWFERTPVRKLVAYEVGGVRYELLKQDVIDYADEER
ncbi:MAG: hypothetical protein ACKVU1_12015 [bacterium]